MNREQRRQQAERQRQHAEQGRLSSEQQRHTNEGGYADHQLRVTVQVGEQPAQHRLLETMEQAKAWAEEQLR